MQNKYSVSIMPTGSTDTEIRKIKSELKNIIGNYPSASADPHITLFDYSADEIKQKIFEKQIRQICGTITPFTVSYKGFDEFHQNKTIYVALEEHSYKTIIQVRKKFSAELKHGKYDEEVNFDTGKSPHITVARSIQDETQFITAKKYFLNKKFEGSFICNEIALRLLVKGDRFTKYEVITKFPFAKESLSLF